MATGLALVILVIGGGFWLVRDRAERREGKARQEERETQTVEATLEQASALGRQGRWPDARAVLEGAPILLSSTTPANLRERLMQARSDANMAAKLEGIRMGLARDTAKTRGTVAPLYADYAEAFRSYFGLDLLILEPEEAAARVGNSAIRETLLAYIHDWHYCSSDADRAKLRALLDRADDDPWRRAWREAVAVRDTTVPRDTKRMVELAAKAEALAQPPLVLSGLGGVLLIDGHREETLAFLREAQQRHSEDFWLNYLLGQYWEKENPQVAVGYFRAAVAIRPRDDSIYTKLGRALVETGDAEGAVAAFGTALELNPNADVARNLAKLWVSQSKLEALRCTWKKSLECDPPDHDSWNGYAELCLFLGREDDYLRARRDLLNRFGATTDPYVAERTSRACLLRPATGDELCRAVALAERAAAVDQSQYASAYPWFLFSRGLAEYRQGRFEQAIATMRGDGSRVLAPAPRLVLAMALHQSGQETEAREAFAAAVLAYDWRATHVRDVHDSIRHVLSREAEAMILPTPHAFRQGDRQP
jgi:serine/threonine-protein kinase